MASSTRSPEDTVYHVVVIGGGPIGLSTAYQCAKAGANVLLLERFTLYNQSGSSNDMTRMFRTMYTEDYMADLAHEAINDWKQLESDCGEQLIEMSGLLNFGDPNYGAGGPEGTLLAPIKNLDRLNMKYQRLDVDQIECEFPFRDLPRNFEGLWAPDNGCINVPLVLRVLATMSEAKGACMIQWARVCHIQLDENGVIVDTLVGQDGLHQKRKKFRAKKCAITAGAYTNHILQPSFGFRFDLEIWEMVYEYYACDSNLIYKASDGASPDTVQSKTGKPFKSMWFQFAENDNGSPAESNLFYGFPTLPWGLDNAARIAVDNAVRKIADPSDRLLVPSSYDIQRTRNFIDKHLKGVDLQPNYAGTCLQTNVYDNMFVLDHLPPGIPGAKNVAVFTAGWAFKFVPLLGIVLKQMLLDDGVDPKYDISHFKMTRSDGTHSVIASKPPLRGRNLETTICKGSSSHVSQPVSAVQSINTGIPNRFRRDKFALRVAPCTKLYTGALVPPNDGEKTVEDNKRPKIKVGIIGAGAAGLYAALILKDLKIDCEILEANTERVGGRIFTYYFEGARGAKPGTAEYYNYFDVGAMRIPNIPIHARVIGEKEEWSLVNYLNNNISGDSNPIKLVKYNLSDPNNLMYYNGILKTVDEVDKSSDSDPFKFRPTGSEAGGGELPKTGALLDAAMDSFKTVMMEDFDKGFEALMPYDHMSVQTYLQSFLKPLPPVSYQGKYSNGIVSWLETMESSSGMYAQASFTESVMDSFDFDYPEPNVEWKCVDGGMTRLVEGMLDVLKNKFHIEPKMGRRVNKIGAAGESKVQLTIVDEGAKLDKQVYDHVISTVPFSVLRTIDTADCNLTEGKRVAMRVLHYDSSTKVGISFKTRFWQKDEYMPLGPCFGGQSSTDLPVRTIVYPSYGTENSAAPGVLIASYTWTQDAQRMGAISPEERLEVCLQNLKAIHGKDAIEEQYLGPEHTFSLNWYAERYEQGAFALFGPGQFVDMFDDAIKSELNGHLHFAGEATSVHHAWIVGALNSAYRSVAEILLTLPKADQYIKKLQKRWGTVDEIDLGVLQL